MRASAFLALVCLGAFLSQALGAETGSRQTNGVMITSKWISTLAAEMIRTHPAIKAAGARTNAAAADTAAVRVWEDPMVRVGGMLGPTMMRSEDGDILYGVEQTLPLFGKPGAARRLASASETVEAANLDYRVQQMRTDLTKTLFQAALWDEVIAIGEQDVSWLSALVSSEEARYRSGQTGLPEFLRLQNERALRQSEVESDKDRLRQTHGVLNRLLGRSSDGGWSRLVLPVPGPQMLVNAKVLEMARSRAPQTEVIRGEIERGKRSVELARKQRLPEFKAGVDGRNYSGDGEFRQGMVFVAMSVPWLNSEKYNKDILREQEKLRASEYDLQSYERQLEDELQDFAVASNAALRRARTYKDQVLPRIESSLTSAQAAWESGRSTAVALLEARRELLDARIQYARAVAEQHIALSEIALRCGLPDTQSGDALPPER